MTDVAAPNASETATTVMPSTTATSTTTEMSATTLWGRLKQREMRLAEINPDGYSPGAQPTVRQLIEAAKELKRRIPAAVNREEAGEDGLGAPPPYQGEFFNHPQVPRPRGDLDGEDNENRTTGDGLDALVPYPDVLNFPWVLVATDCDNFPRNRMLEAEAAAGGKFKMFLGNDGSLFLIAVCELDLHGTCVNAVLDGCNMFDRPLRMFFCHSNVVAQIPGGRFAPDCALKHMHPTMLAMGGTLRAPFVAEVHSGNKTVATSLNYLSLFLDQAVSDYVMYVHAYPKHADSTYAAVAIIWRAGQGAAPLGPGVMANFVSAHSFGSANLSPASIAALGLNHGHLPGVPAAHLVRAAPVMITIPRAHLLHGAVDHLGNLLPAAVRNNGPDLQIDLPRLRHFLNFVAF